MLNRIRGSLWNPGVCFLLSETLQANLSCHVDEVHGKATDREFDAGGRPCRDFDNMAYSSKVKKRQTRHIGTFLEYFAVTQWAKKVSPCFTSNVINVEYMKYMKCFPSGLLDGSTRFTTICPIHPFTHVHTWVAVKFSDGAAAGATLTLWLQRSGIWSEDSTPLSPGCSRNPNIS